MAFVRSPRGAKTRFSVAKLAHSITQAYVGAMGTRTTHHRGQIQSHAHHVHAALRAQLGEASGVEWSRSAIQQAIEAELRRNAPVEVHEFFLEHMAAKRKTKAPQKEHWDRFEAMPVENPDRVDPVWAVVRADALAAVQPEVSDGPLSSLGQMARKPAKKPKSAETNPSENKARRSHWMAWFQTQARQVTHAFDFEAFERLILRMPPDFRSQSDESWWVFWQERLDEALRMDPRAVGMLRVLHERRERARVLGESWLKGTGIPGTEKAGKMSLEIDKANEGLYRALWLETIQRQARSPEGDPRFLQRFDLKVLAKAIQPQRDRLLDWRGWQWLATTEALWALVYDEWTGLPGVQPSPDARELPQWAWMRTAMGLAVLEDNPTERALDFYEAFSTLVVIPSETMLREAGKTAPRYMEDEAGVVHDEFESIHNAIHRAAVNTKWTGTIALDWREVRAQGAPIAGRRISQGPIGFLRSIHSSLAAQGRSGEDRPVTVSLPLWHRDIESFLDLRHGEGARLQPVVAIPDLFFERLQTGEPWLLIDPAAYPDLLKGGAKAYEAAEADWKAKGSKNGPTVKSIASDRLWKRLIQAMTAGSPFLAFEGSDKAFAPFPLSAPPVGGIDGVGAMPVPLNEETPFVSWPAMAMDLSKTLSKEGKPEPDKMRKAAMVAMRALDNAIDASREAEGSSTLYYRPVCLGAVGFFEAINRGSSSDNDPELLTAWVAGLAEAWGAVVTLADQQLRRERGAAPAWQEADALPFDPMGAMERLKEARHGSMGHRPQPRQDWKPERFRQGHRCSVRTVWAPYQGAAKVAGVTPGGMGTLRPLDLIIDEDGNARWCPTPLLMELMRQRPEDIEDLRNVLRFPHAMHKWPAIVRHWTYPDAEGWDRRLVHAAHIRPWIDQGVSLTLPVGMKPELLGPLVRRAWWMGLSNIRFEAILPTETVISPQDDEDGMDNPRKDG